MAVCSEDQLTRADIMLHHDLVAYTLALPEINVVLSCEVAHLLLGCSSLRAVRRNIVIHDKDHLLRICNMWMF